MRRLNQLIRHAEEAVLRGYNFILNVHYYRSRGFTLRAAIYLARNTL